MHGFCPPWFITTTPVYWLATVIAIHSTVLSSSSAIQLEHTSVLCVFVCVCVGGGRIKDHREKKTVTKAAKGLLDGYWRICFKIPSIITCCPVFCQFCDLGNAQIFFAGESYRVKGVSLCPTSVPIKGIRRRMHSKTMITLATYFHISVRVC